MPHGCQQNLLHLNVSTGFWTQTKDDAICLGFIPKTSSLAQVYKKRESQGQLNLLDLVH